MLFRSPTWVISVTEAIVNTNQALKIKFQNNTGAKRAGSISYNFQGVIKNVKIVQAAGCTENPPTDPQNKTYCTGDTIPAISAIVGSGETIDWYSASIGGTLLLSGSLSYTPSSAGTYYAKTRNITTGCTSNSNTAVTLTESAPPSTPSVGTITHPT